MSLTDLERLADRAWAEADPTGNVRKIRAAKWLCEQTGSGLAEAARLVQGAMERAKPNVGVRLDLDVARAWAQSCGSCDAGLPMSCTCRTDDPRPVIADLLAEVQRARPYLNWLIALDEPGNGERRTITLDQIIQRAKAVRDA